MPYIEGYYTQMSQELIASLFEIKEKNSATKLSFFGAYKKFFKFFKKVLKCLFYRTLRNCRCNLIRLRNAKNNQFWHKNRATSFPYIEGHLVILRTINRYKIFFRMLIH